MPLKSQDKSHDIHPPRGHHFPKRLIAVVVEDLRAAFHAFAGDESDLLRAGAPDLQRLWKGWNQKMSNVPNS